MRTLLINNRIRLAMPTATVSAFGQLNKEACKIFGGQKCTAHSLPRKLAYVGLAAMLLASSTFGASSAALAYEGKESKPLKLEDYSASSTMTW